MLAASPLSIPAPAELTKPRRRRLWTGSNEAFVMAANFAASLGRGWVGHLGYPDKSEARSVAQCEATSYGTVSAIICSIHVTTSISFFPQFLKHGHVARRVTFGESRTETWALSSQEPVGVLCSYMLSYSICCRRSRRNGSSGSCRRTVLDSSAMSMCPYMPTDKPEHVHKRSFFWELARPLRFCRSTL